MRRKNKSPEISRLIDFMRSKNMKAAELAASLELPERTLNNVIWSNTPLSGRLLRKLLAVHGLSIDWLVTGQGERFSGGGIGPDRDDLPEECSEAEPLIPFYETITPASFVDYWWLAARATEQSLMTAGALPGRDYSIMDCYKLSRPFVMERLRSGNLAIETAENF